MILNLKEQFQRMLYWQKKKDSSGVEQLTVCFRWVGKDLYVYEDFMGLYS